MIEVKYLYFRFLRDSVLEIGDHENRLLEQLFVDWVPLVRRDTGKCFQLVPVKQTAETRAPKYDLVVLSRTEYEVVLGRTEYKYDRKKC